MNIMRDTKKWRKRYELATQIGELSKLYKAETVFRFIFPICLKLCNDTIAEVRVEAARHIKHIIIATEDTEYQGIVIETIRGYGLSNQCRQKETFARMIRVIYDLPYFKDKVNHIMFDLAKDPIMNARIALARSVRQLIKQDPKNRELFVELIEVMKADDIDVS